MRLTKEDIKNNPELSNLSGWLKGMQQHAKSATPPVFEIDGPRQILVRFRGAPRGKKMMGGGTMRSGGDATRNHSFMGGEKFQLIDVFQHVDAARNSVLIQATFMPADLSLSSDMANFTLPLEEAVDTLVGMQAWIEGITPLEKPKKISKEERIDAERAENEESGAW
jgi:hypothetical protein